MRVLFRRCLILIAAILLIAADVSGAEKEIPPLDATYDESLDKLRVFGWRTAGQVVDIIQKLDDKATAKEAPAAIGWADKRNRLTTAFVTYVRKNQDAFAVTPEARLAVFRLFEVIRAWQKRKSFEAPPGFRPMLLLAMTNGVPDAFPEAGKPGILADALVTECARKRPDATEKVADIAQRVNWLLDTDPEGFAVLFRSRLDSICGESEEKDVVAVRKRIMRFHLLSEVRKSMKIPVGEPVTGYPFKRYVYKLVQGKQNRDIIAVTTLALEQDDLFGVPRWLLFAQRGDARFRLGMHDPAADDWAEGYTSCETELYRFKQRLEKHFPKRWEKIETRNTK